MGVTVSYKGSGGSRAFNLDGVPTGDAAKALGLPKKKHFVPQMLADALKMPQPEDPIKAEKENKVKLNRLDMNPGTLEDKVLPGGGVVVSQRGVCLRGEEDSPLVTGTKLFGSVNGSKKYHSIDEIDPKGEPHHVGAKHGDASVDPNNEAAVEKQSQSYQVTSRIVVERDDIAKLLKFYEFDKDVSTSSFGRTVGVTAERRRMICAIRYLEGGGKTPPPGNFEPVFAEDQSDHKTKLDDVGEGFCPFGRVFYSNVTVDSSAKIERGYIYLEVVHPVSSSSVPTIYVKGATGKPAFDNTNDTSKSLIPLYFIDGGRIIVDYRSCMSLTIREL